MTTETTTVTETTMVTETKKLALVTGATRGIGFEVAIRLAKKGIRVIGTATAEDGVSTLQSKLLEYGPDHKAVKLELLRQDGIQQAIKDLISEIGPPDILIHNAGITRDNLILRMPEQDWHQVIDVNLNSIFHLVKPCLRHMLSKRWGRVVVIGSVAAHLGSPGQAQYCASKAGLEGFVKALAREVASRHICANVIAPGFIETDMTDQLPEARRQDLLSQIPMKRFGYKSEIAGVAEFLLSESAAYITGAVIPVNGGMAMN